MDRRGSYPVEKMSSTVVGRSLVVDWLAQFFNRRSELPLLVPICMSSLISSGAALGSQGNYIRNNRTLDIEI